MKSIIAPTGKTAKYLNGKTLESFSALSRKTRSNHHLRGLREAIPSYSPCGDAKNAENIRATKILGFHPSGFWEIMGCDGSHGIDGCASHYCPASCAVPLSPCPPVLRPKRASRGFFPSQRSKERRGFGVGSARCLILRPVVPRIGLKSEVPVPTPPPCYMGYNLYMVKFVFYHAGHVGGDPT